MNNKGALKKDISHFYCHVCGQTSLKLVADFESFSQVTSDCKPWPAGNRLGICQSCGCVQKIIDAIWRSGTEKIYKNYSIYHQSDGIEQAVFDKDSGEPSHRSERLIDFLVSGVSLPEKGSLLDVGCGNGGLLRTFNRLVPLWSLAGTEYDDKHREKIESITAGATLYTCHLNDIPETFNLITMLHILEHILDPAAFLKQISARLIKEGILLVEAPDYRQNPFDLLVSDHCTHFTLSALTELLRKAGFGIVASSKNWVPKEISIIAEKGFSQGEKGGDYDDSGIQQIETVNSCLEWIESLRQSAKDISLSGNFGIFGTSIAATWLFCEIGGAVSFFVDEDPNRAGKTYMGLPVYHPRDIPMGGNVFLSLPSKIASNVLQRLERPDVKYHLPPSLEIRRN